MNGRTTPYGLPCPPPIRELQGIVVISRPGRQWRQPRDIVGKETAATKNGAPKGTRTPVSGVRGRRPGPLDDGGSGACHPSACIPIGSNAMNGKSPCEDFRQKPAFPIFEYLLQGEISRGLHFWVRSASHSAANRRACVRSDGKSTSHQTCPVRSTTPTGMRLASLPIAAGNH